MNFDPWRHECLRPAVEIVSFWTNELTVGARDTGAAEGETMVLGASEGQQEKLKDLHRRPEHMHRNLSWTDLYHFLFLPYKTERTLSL